MTRIKNMATGLEHPMQKSKMTYQPPFSISSRAVSLVAEISALVERYVIRLEQSDALKLRRANRIKTIHSSLAIEGNALSLKQVTDIRERSVESASHNDGGTCGGGR